uniref:Protein MEMO1 n=1 Tax=Rhodosorus marinus TaxID=101924 RepID=A0A7S2ZRM8_9RHOD|mmetsp:Transcript_28762/g.112172  ORF Transcript_28762/g.112172 Transcript_28762/m.112172 type:complete len:184 (+) Transcript_28762:209-760(+)
MLVRSELLIAVLVYRLNSGVSSAPGSWYSGDREHLTTQLAHWMQNAGDVGFQHNLRAVIAPHAGYSYSGPTAGYAYAAIDPTKYDRVIVLGPSHHVYLDHCCVTAQKYLETPVGTLKVDEEFNTELKASGLFQSMDRSVDEDEHSIEMHLPSGPCLLAPFRRKATKSTDSSFRATCQTQRIFS